MRRQKAQFGIIKGSVLVGVLTLWAAVLAGCSGSSDDTDSASKGNSAAVSMQDQAVPGAVPAAEANRKSVALDSSGDSLGVSSSTSEDRAAAPEQGTSATSSPAGSALSAASIGVIADANAGFNRKMIYTANVVVKAKSFATAEETVSNAIFQSGGFIVQFADTKSESEIGSTYVIKVPSSGLSDFISRLEKIPNEDFNRKMQGNDVTEEYVDLESRLAAKQTVEARLLAFMEKATKADDLVKFSNELGSVQEEIEQIKGRMRYLDQNVAYSTVNLRLYQTIVPEAATKEGEAGKTLGAKLTDAMKGSADVLEAIGEALLTFVAAVLPVLAVVIVIGGPIFWVAMRTRGSRRAQAERRRKLLNAEIAASPAAPEAAQAAPRNDFPEGKDD